MITTNMNILLFYPLKEYVLGKDLNWSYDPKNKKQPLFFQRLLSKIKPTQQFTTLTMLSIAAVTPKKHHVEIIEGDISDINFDKKYDLVGISSYTGAIYAAYEVADEFKRRGITVVLGGGHSSAVPEEAKQHADSVVIGEAEENWPKLLNDLENGRLRPFYYQTTVVDLEKLPIPKSISSKKISCRVQATRGCPYGCEFCSVSSTKYRKIFRMRPIKDVVREIQLIPSKLFGFDDDSLTINPSYTKELFRQIKKAGINKKFYAQGNINTLGNDEEFLKTSSEAGCMSWFVGFESVNQDSIDSMGKNSNKVKEYSSSIKKLHDYGMYIQGSFILGFDTDKKDIFDKTVDFIKKYDVDHPLFNILTPYPGTRLFDRLDKEGRILTRDWAKYNMHNVVFEPKNMTPKELLDNTVRISNEVYSYPSVIGRTVKSMKFVNLYTASVLTVASLKRKSDYQFNNEYAYSYLKNSDI